jgi:crotonobetainyl-CoA:carnitine CoA-transferase CaiB-like acyl-CoA transferase
MDWLRSETWRAYERPESEVTGNKSDGYARRAPGTAGMRDGVRYQFYETADGHILFQASEREFWENFCRGIDRADLFESHPGSQYADHALGDTELRRELQTIFLSRPTAEWVELGARVNTPIVQVNTPRTLADDPQFQDRMPWIPAGVVGADQLPTPLRFLDTDLPTPSKAPTVGQHTEEVLREVLCYDDDRIATLRAAGALG